MTTKTKTGMTTEGRAGFVVTYVTPDLICLRRNDRSKLLAFEGLEAGYLRSVLARFPVSRNCPTQSAQYRTARKALMDFYNYYGATAKPATLA